MKVRFQRVKIKLYWITVALTCFVLSMAAFLTADLNNQDRGCIACKAQVSTILPFTEKGLRTPVVGREYSLHISQDTNLGETVN